MFLEVLLLLWGMLPLCLGDKSSTRSELEMPCGKFTCKRSMDLLCCEYPDYFCCNYDTFVQSSNTSDIDDMTDDTFVRVGLKSALVLLILSSAIFLLCFCVMRCCKRATMRSPSHMSTSLAEYRRGQTMDPRSPGGVNPHAIQLLSMRLSQSTTSHRESIDDEPPGYSEVILPDSYTDVPVQIEVEKPPPEYSSIIKEDTTSQRS